MSRKLVLVMTFTLVLAGLVSVPFEVQRVKAGGTIYIRADGSVKGTDKIERDEDVYTFTDNIYDEIVVERDDILVDGAGYTLQGPGASYSKGIDLTGRINITINNMEIKAFYYGIYLSSSSNNILSGNNISKNAYGIYLEFSHDNKLYHNNFKGNVNQFQIYNCPSNTWDNGYPSGGNYWSDHNPPDIYGGPYKNETGRDRIGDIPYVIDENNVDRYPLIYPYGRVPSPDLNDDGIVDIYDAVMLATAYGSYPGHPSWNPMADINQDGNIDIYDVTFVNKLKDGVQDIQLMKLGLSTDRYMGYKDIDNIWRELSPQEYYDYALPLKFYVHHFQIAGKLLGPPPSGDYGQIAKDLDWVTEFATICDTDSKFEIVVTVTPWYGWDSKMTGSEKSDRWWVEIVDYMLERLSGHQSILGVGLYVWEWFAYMIWPEAKAEDIVANWTIQQHNKAFKKFNQKVQQFGFEEAHYRGSYRPWSSWEEMQQNIGRWFYPTGYPSPNAGWIWTQYPADEWQYEWVKKYVINGKLEVNTYMLASGMWAGESTFGWQGKGWTYRNTKWYLDAAKEATIKPERLLFQAWVNVMIPGENDEFRQAVNDFNNEVFPPPAGGAPPPAPPPEEEERYEEELYKETCMEPSPKFRDVKDAEVVKIDLPIAYCNVCEVYYYNNCGGELENEFDTYEC